VWVHLPCLRQAAFAFFPDPELGTGVSLLCPACGREAVLVDEDQEEEEARAAERWAGR
jgi:hypothetical protein